MDSSSSVDISYAEQDQDLVQISDIEVLPTECFWYEWLISFMKAKLEELETEYSQTNNSLEILTRNHNELVELKLVLEKSVPFLGQVWHSDDWLIFSLLTFQKLGKSTRV